MLNSLSMATGGYLSNGEYSSLSIAINGMLLTYLDVWTMTPSANTDWYKDTNSETLWNDTLSANSAWTDNDKQESDWGAQALNDTIWTDEGQGVANWAVTTTVDTIWTD
jgi:hypothetical protein